MYALTIKKFYRPNPNGIQLPSSASLPPVRSNHEAQTEAAQVNIDTDADITGKENKNEASDEEEAEITHHTSTAEYSNADDDSHDDENKAEVMDQRSFGNDKIIQLSFYDKGVALELTLVTKEMRDVFDKIREDLGKDAFDDIPEKVEDDGTSMEVDDYDEDAIEREVVDEANVIHSADTEPKLQRKCSFPVDLKAFGEILNIPSDVTVTDDVLETIDVCSEIIEDGYKRVQNNDEAEATAIAVISLNTLFDPGPNDLMVKESPELKPDDVVYFEKRENYVIIRQVIRSKDAVKRVKVEEVIKMLDGKTVTTEKPMPEKVPPTKLVKVGGKWVRADAPEVVTAQSSCMCCCPGHCKYSVHSMSGALMGVNSASKVDTDSEQMEFPSIFENSLFKEVDHDMPIKSSLVVERDELYDVITSLETDFNLD